jgi:hypothetical protein
MNERKTRSGPTSATEFMVQLEQDEGYQRRKATRRAEVEVMARELGLAEEPIVAALKRAGVQVDSVWDLVNTSAPYPLALPVLMQHLEQGGYPERVMESLGRALAVKPAVVYWDRIKELYLAPRDPGEEDGAAVALAACATSAQFDDLIGFFSLSERGESRIYFIRPVLALGGQKGREFVHTLLSDQVFGKEARALLTA